MLHAEWAASALQLTPHEVRPIRWTVSVRSVVIRAIVSLTAVSFLAGACAAPSGEAVVPSPSSARPTETAAKTPSVPKTAAEIVVTASDLPSDFKQLFENATCAPATLPNPRPQTCFERYFARIPPAPGSLTLDATALVYANAADATEAFARILKVNYYVPTTATEVPLSESIGDEFRVYQEAFTGSTAPQFRMWTRTGPVVTYVQTGNLADVTRLGKLQVARAAEGRAAVTSSGPAVVGSPAVIPAAPTSSPVSNVVQSPKIGSPVVYSDGFKLTVLGLEEQPASGLFVPSAGMRLVTVIVRFDNGAAKTFAVNPFNFSLQDGQGFRRSPRSSNRNDQLRVTDVSPGGVLAGSLTFDAPIGDTRLSLIYTGYDHPQATVALY